MTKLTNQQVEEAIIVLERWNPGVSFETKLRISRNLRKLRVLQSDKEHDRLRLVYSSISDKSKKPDNQPNQSLLSAEEQLRFQPEYKKLLGMEVEVDIHPLELYDGAENQVPKDPKHAIDISKVAIPNDVLAALIDWMLFPHRNGEPCPNS